MSPPWLIPVSGRHHYPARTIADAPPFDLRARARQAVLDAGFAPELPADAEAELRGPTPPDADSAAVRDLRELPCSSIDNDGSRDLDQVEWAEETVPGKEARLLVGIADVDCLVPRGSALDAHASRNAVSVYAGAAVFPMLPSELSTDRSSLNGGAERLTVVTEMRIDLHTGETLGFDVYRARLRNAAALTYETLAGWFENRASVPPAVSAVPGLAEQLQLQLRIAKALRAFRQQAGALAFSSVEARAVTNPNTGEVTGLTVVTADPGRDQIESFMIAANVAMARFLQSKGAPVLRRVVHTPDQPAWERIRAIAAEHHDAIPAGPADARALSDFLARRRAADTPDRFAELSLSVIKMLGAGIYVAQMPGAPAEGHFGLAAPDYSHSTAPNRRFADLLTQRLLKAALLGRPSPYPADELTALAAHCTERESAARKVERLMRKVAAAALLAPRVGETFRAVVTGSSPKGVFVRLLPPGPPAEGRVVRAPVGHPERPAVGVRMSVTLLGVDAARGFIDFGAA